ncbi:response regulator [Coleofasciculus sp. FACHB-SPT9]|uniref:response regulator n=1 Tax=Cyanophyceae TaxID=3028117 RepID=UPI0016824213|nr:response regulator [Coleofasciculus sp. FACHB-SPT9]MBD1889846.1 response regulator [Coleofasciculus sp. FACHB-SPT9]
MSNPQNTFLKCNILIVDDNPANLELLGGILSEQGYKVRLMPDGQLALRSVQSTRPDLILLDILMPEMDGYQVCEKLKADERTKDIPVIFVSAVHEVFDKVKAFSLGGVDYITKPFEAKEVLARIETQLRISRLSKQLLEQNARLTEQKELLQTIFDHIPVMVTLYDANGRIQLVNLESERVLGWSHTELENIDLIAECVPDPEYRTSVLEHMFAATGKWQDFKARIRDGSYLDTSWASIRLSNGMSIGIGQDISERVAAALRDHKQALEASLLEERNRMAQEIHDTLAQAFTGIIVHLGTASRKITVDPAAAQEHIKVGRDLARSGLTEARRSVEALRPKLLEDGDLCSAVRCLSSQMFSHSSTHTICEVLGKAYPLPQDVENNVLRIGQEALTNAFKYARASEIRIELVYETRQFILRIKDNGQGFEINSFSVENGFGLMGMTERADRIGAKLTIQSQPGRGTEVVVSLDRE